MIIGTVSFWQWEKKQYDGWGFILPDGYTGDKADRVYFNSKSARYSPVAAGDRVEVTLLDKIQDMSKHVSCAAFKVSLVENENENETETTETRATA